MTDGLRHEYKYLISAADARLLKLRLKHIMEPDPHVGKTGQYTIRSLYFDDLTHSALDEKLDGAHVEAAAAVARDKFAGLVLACLPELN